MSNTINALLMFTRTLAHEVFPALDNMTVKRETISDCNIVCKCITLGFASAFPPISGLTVPQRTAIGNIVLFYTRTVGDDYFFDSPKVKLLSCAVYAKDIITFINMHSDKYCNENFDFLLTIPAYIISELIRSMSLFEVITPAQNSPLPPGMPHFYQQPNIYTILKKHRDALIKFPLANPKHGY